MTNPKSQLRFIVIGRAGMDLYPEPAGTKTAEATRFSAMLGGSAANIAAGLARLGAQVELMTALSDDPVGRFCAAQLEAFGIGQGLVSTSGPDTRTSLALSENRLEDHETVIYRNGAADFDLAVDLPDRMELDGLAALVVTGTALAREPSRAVTLHAIARAQEARVPVVLDLDYRPYSWASARDASEVYAATARRSDIVVGNDLEFAILQGTSDPSPDYARQLSNDGPETCIYKMGQDGAITFHAGAESASGIYPVTALKPVGAGDAFLASFLAARFSGGEMSEAVRRGSAAAALVVSRPGCSNAMPLAEEVTAFMLANIMTAPGAVEG
ncbi:PfkB family carbohydrate kinase [Vannielia litorea]|uniref:5-dehydro-2-deoxygluconokinase n=1 Tax=Vannielia litorea TaxID=1217970 RepID=A0A1N6IFR8_9RHOB|nr:PfkB family carbohydrate kinase [Vannielia litorea]SIO30872.1 5-dehydro-2-deoxygluconokinase [Vannielia litorea]